MAAQVVAVDLGHTAVLSVTIAESWPSACAGAHSTHYIVTWHDPGQRLFVLAHFTVWVGQQKMGAR